MTPKRKPAAIYCRISKDTGGRRLGVDRQEAECRDLADRLGLDVPDEYVFVDNDLSAYSGRRRPGYEAMTAAMRAGEVGAVICWHNDRLTRHPRELGDLIGALEEARVKVHTVQDGEYDLATPSGRMAARIVGAVARGESEHKSARLRSKMDQLAASGAAPGGRAPYGYRKADTAEDGTTTGAYIVDKAEAHVVRRIAKLILRGDSLLSIARTLTAEGVPTRTGKAWHHSTVRQVVTNPAVAGRRVHRQRQNGGRTKAVVGVGEWAPILTGDLFDEVAVVLSDPARRRKRAAPHEYLLTGLIRSTDGDPMRGRIDKDRRTYATYNDRAGAYVTIDADKAEALVVAAALEVLDGIDLTAPEAEPDDVDAIAAELDELARLRGEGTISLSEWMTAREPLTARLEAAQAARGHRARPVIAGKVSRHWDDLDLADRRAVLAEAVDAIHVAPAGGRGRWAIPADRIRIAWKV